MRAISAIAVALASLAVAVSAMGAKPSPVTTTTNALTRFLNDTRALSPGAASAKTRRVLLDRAQRVQKNAFKKPCRAVRLIRSYRNGLDKVSDADTAAPGGKPGPASVRGTLERDALAVDAGLKQLPGTRKCGGGATKAGATLDTKVARSSKTVLKLHVKLPVARWEARSGGGRDFIGVNMDSTDSVGAVGDPA